MLKSMTAYSRSNADTSLGKFVIEIQSVNKRHFEIQCYLPHYLQRFDSKIRALLSNHIHRGQITVRINTSSDSARAPAVHVNIPLMKQYEQAWRQVANELGYDKDFKLPLTLFGGQAGLLAPDSEIEDEEAFWITLRQGIEEALKTFQDARLREGQKLQEDLLQRCRNLLQWAALIEVKAVDAPIKYREKLKEKLEQILPGSVENDERILREVCLYADKVDITEESVRLKTHLHKLQELLSADLPYVGKEIEFLLQEITREINTTGSKTNDIYITQWVLAMKNEVERVKEQVQNIE